MRKSIKTSVQEDVKNTAVDDNDPISLRPTSLNDYIGQSSIKESLSIALKSTQLRNAQLEHILLYGPPGLGKTTLANIIANELGVPFVTTVGNNIEKPADVASLLNNIQDKSIVFIDEIHRMNKVAEECLYSAMEDGYITITIGAAEQAKTIKLPLPPFTLIGATTRVGMLSSPLRDRFIYQYKMEYYSDDELYQIVEKTIAKLDIQIPVDDYIKIASVSRGTPRVANKYCILTRDYYVVNKDNCQLSNIVPSTLRLAGVNEDGLYDTEITLLKTLFISDKPVGLSTISHIIGEDEQTVEDVYEPYLIMKQLIIKTPRGREITEKGKEYIKRWVQK